MLSESSDEEEEEKEEELNRLKGESEKMKVSDKNYQHSEGRKVSLENPSSITTQEEEEEGAKVGAQSETEAHVGVSVAEGKESVGVKGKERLIEVNANHDRYES